MMRILLCTCLLAICFSSCKEDLSSVQEAMAKLEPQKEHGEDITMMYSEDGKLKIKLTAPTVIRVSSDDPYYEFPDGLNVLFYDDLKQVESELRANYGIRYELRGQTIFRDSVYVRNVNEETLYTEELIWNEAEEKIYSDRFVRVVTPDERIVGSGFEANQDLTNFRVLKVTNTILTIEEEE